MKSETELKPSTTSLFFIKNAQHNTKPLELYLERRDYSVQTESNLSLAIEKVKELKPSYVFAAWDHTDPNIQKIASQLPEDIVVIPYITSNSNAHTHRLMALDVPLKIFPPLTGPAIQRLISKFGKDKQGSAKLQNSNLSSKVDRSSEDSKQIFINKGQRFKDMNKVITNRISGENSDLSFFDSITDLTTSKPIAQFSKNMHIRLSESQKKSLESKFEAKIQQELNEIIETAKESTPPDQRQTIYCMLVQAIDCSGLILLNTEWNISLEDAEAALSSWANELTFQYHKNDGIKNIYQSEIFSVSTPNELNVFEICNSKSAVKKEMVIDGKNTTLAFFDLQYNPFNLESTDNDNYLLVDHNCLKQDSTLTVDLFFELKENQKILKMFKKDTLMSAKEVNSVLEKKIIPLLISMGDEISWYKYGVEAYLKQK